MQVALTDKKYYVYFLVHKQRVVYVGKGTGSRVLRHWYHARRGKESPLYDFMRRVYESGQTVEYCIADTTDSEDRAFELEALYIRHFGKESLLNQRSGVAPLWRIPHIDPDGNRVYTEKLDCELTLADCQLLADHYRVKFKKYQALAYRFKAIVAEAGSP